MKKGNFFENQFKKVPHNLTQKDRWLFNEAITTFNAANTIAFNTSEKYVSKIRSTKYLKKCILFSQIFEYRNYWFHCNQRQKTEILAKVTE